MTDCLHLTPCWRMWIGRVQSNRSAARGSLGRKRRARWCVSRACVALSMTVAAITATPLVAIAQSPAAWKLEREASIGSSAGADPYLFTKILATLPTSRGSLVVADSRQRTVRVFGPSGAFTHSVGREGRGPGEFMLLFKIGLVGDTVWTLDRTLLRTTLFGLDGVVIKTLPWETGGPKDEGRNQVEGLFADGTAWGESTSHMAAVMRGGPELPKPILRMSRAGATMDTIATVSTSHTMFAVWNGPRGTFGDQSFPDGDLVIGVPSQSRLYVVGRAAATSSRTANVSVVALRSTGDTLWKRDLSYSPRRLEKSVVDSEVRRLGLKRGSDADALLRVFFTPQFLPPITSGFAADDGAVWLRREQGRATVEYWILTPDGTLTATLTVPQTLTLTAARGSQVWSVQNNADDVPAVVRFRIDR